LYAPHVAPVLSYAALTSTSVVAPWPSERLSVPGVLEPLFALYTRRFIAKWICG
jgi:hypothetical protein